MSYTTQ